MWANFSAYGHEKKMDHSSYTYGDHETVEADNEEIDLHTQFNNCQKNPGHKGFFPVDALTLNKLPEQCNEELRKLIKYYAALTVRLAVNSISHHRPEFWPKTANPYPFYNKMEGKKIRTGTGTVQRVIQITNGIEDEYGHRHWTQSNVCTCEKCQHADSPSRVWWSVVILTAAHVIYDNNEASQTSCKLFYDRKDSPLVTLTKARVENVNISEDSCTMSFMTCDAALANKLTSYLKRARNLLATVQEDYKSSRDVLKLTFIVSHPHGCSKQVSVGQWTEKKMDKEFKYLHRFIYTACTCSGSSGAQVIIIGYSGSHWRFRHVHSGTLNHRLNYSGVGYTLFY